jgi:hypothetical protein
MASKYQKYGANCMRLAEESNDTVLSLGFMKMAQAWLDLEKSRRRDPRRDFGSGIGLSRRGELIGVLPMAENYNRWNSARDSLDLVQGAFRHEAKTLQLELAKMWRGVTDYIHVALGLRTSPSALRQDRRLSRILFSLGRTGLLVGIGEALQARYAPVGDQLPERLARILKQAEEVRPEGAAAAHRRTLSKHTRSRRVNRRTRLSSHRTIKRKTALKPPDRRVRSSG